MGGHRSPVAVVRRWSEMQDPRLWPRHYIDDLLHRIRYRFSWFPSRRRAAYAALLEVIRWREADLWPEPLRDVNNLARAAAARPQPCTCNGLEWERPVTIMGGAGGGGGGSQPSVFWASGLEKFVAVGRVDEEQG